MEPLVVTRHARARAQQRGIKTMQLQLLKVFGEDQLQKGGAYLSRVPEKTIRQIRDALDTLGSIVEVKTADDTSLTVMHQTKKIRTTHYKS